MQLQTPQRILIVDDTPNQAHRLMQILVKEGYVVRVATSGSEPFLISQTSLPDLIVIDLDLAGMSGYELCQRLKGDDRVRDIPVIFMSKLEDMPDREAIFSSGGVDFLIKPFQAEEILARIETHLALRETRQRLAFAEAELKHYQNHLQQVMAQHTAALQKEITRHRQAEAEVWRRNRELNLLNRIIAVSASDQEPEKMLELACQELAFTFEAPQVVAALLDEEKTNIKMVAGYAANQSITSLNTVIPLETLPSFEALHSYKTAWVIENVRQDPRLAPLQALFPQSRSVSLLVLPLVIEGEGVGYLILSSFELRRFTQEEIRLAQNVADQVAGALARGLLSQTRRRLIATIEQTVEGVVITDLEGRILYVNPAFERISGYSRAEILGHNARLLKSGKHDTDFYRELWATIRAGRVWRGRFFNRRKDGRLVIEDAVITPVRDQNGVIVNYIKINRDVTQELQLEEQYRQAQKMESIGRLAGGIAHDFNNLLTSIMGHATLAAEALPPDDPVRSDIEVIQRNAERAAELTRQLLAFARRQTVEPRILNLNELILNMDKMLRRLIGENIELITRTQPELGWIKADSGQIEQILLNLVVNARDAMPEGGRLIIETANVNFDGVYTDRHAEVFPGMYVMLAISDTGIGISEEVKEHIFEPFFTTKEVNKGTGLGLATCFGIVKQNGGHIWLYSELGQGSTFKVYLPQVEAGGRPIDKQDEANHLPGGTETILLVEDDLPVRDLAARVLREQGYTLLEAANGHEALSLIQMHGEAIELLLTDIVMPGINGRNLAEQLAAIQPKVKVLFVSGYTDSVITYQGGLKPNSPFLQKPFTPYALAHKVREVLDQLTMSN